MMFSQAHLMCVQVAAEYTLFPLLISVLLAPVCPIDNVSVDEHLPIQNAGGTKVLSVTLKALTAPHSLFSALSPFLKFQHSNLSF